MSKIYFMCYTEDRESGRADPESVYDWVSSQLGPEAAIEASSWCELACVGEEYETDELRIEVREEIPR